MNINLQRLKCLWNGIGLLYFPITFLGLLFGPAFCFMGWSLIAWPVLCWLAYYLSKHTQIPVRPLRVLALAWALVFIFTLLLVCLVICDVEWTKTNAFHIVMGVVYYVAPIYCWGFGYQLIYRQ